MKITLRKIVTESVFKPGDKVVCLTELAHQELPRYYPPVGTVGVIEDIDSSTIKVRWPENCGVNFPYCWWVCQKHIAKVLED